MLEKDLLLGATQCCLNCDEVKPLEQGEAVVRYGSYIEFTCYDCKQKAKPTYKMEITFKADRELSEEELDLLLATSYVQIESPTDEEGNNTDFGTYIQETNIEKVAN